MKPQRIKLGILVLVLGLAMLVPAAAWGAETGPAADRPQLSLDEAVNAALSYSKTLQLAEYDIDRSREVRDDAGDNVDFIPLGSATVSSDSVYKKLVSSDLSWQMYKKTRNVKADQLVMQVFQAYNNVLNAEEKIIVAEKALANAEWQRRAARIGYRVGTVSLSSQLLAESSYEVSVASLQAAKESRDDAWTKFNALLGVEPSQRYQLTDRAELVPLEVIDLESVVSARLSESPSAWLADRNVDIARLNLDLYNWLDTNRAPYETAKIDLRKAETTAADSKDQIRQLVRGLYYSIRQLEEQYTNVEQNLKSAEETLRVKQVQLAVGTGTKGEVIAAEASVTALKQSRQQIINQHEVTRLAFDKPWAYSGS